MNKKFILPVILVTLLGLAVFVSAYGYNSNEKQIILKVNKGWNLIPAGTWELNDRINSPIKYSDFKYGFVYLPSVGKYVLTLKDGEMIRNYDTGDINWVYSEKEAKQVQASSMWVYSENEGDLILSWKAINLNMFSNLDMSKGWNFIFVTPEMRDKSLNDIKGSCTLEKIYSYYKEASNDPRWVDLSNDFLNEKLTDDSVGFGLLMKVSNDCKFNGDSSVTTPPAIPN